MIYLKHIPDNTPLDLEVAVGPVIAKETFIWGNTQQLVIQAKGGRMNVLDVEAPGSVEQIDGKYALDLGAVDLAETRRFTTPGGQQVTMEVSPPLQLAKWGEGTHYMLERDLSTEDLIVEPGRNHRKLYVTNGAHGYNKAKIAAEVGGGLTEAQVTNAWLKAQTVYGGSAAKALAFDEGLRFWYSITAVRNGLPNFKQSNWLLLERGYSYDNTALTDIHFIPPGVDGESTLHPCVITQYGSGHPAIIKGKGLKTFGADRVVIIGVSNGQFANQINGNWIIFADMINEPGDNGYNISKDVSYRTFYRTSIADVHREVPSDGVTWRALPDRASGIFMNQCLHGLIEDCFLDHNGHKDGYSPTSTSYAVNPNHPPSMYSHNMYLSWSNIDLSIIGTLAARGASMGIQLRSGGRISDVLFIDNQMAGFEGGGSENDAAATSFKGNYALLLRNIITSASFLPAPSMRGAYNAGYELQGFNAVSIDNIAVHAANPNDAAEMAAKTSRGKSVFPKFTPPDFDNHISANWAALDKNVEGLDMAAIKARTIQVFAATKLPSGTAPTIKNFMAWMKTQTPRQRQILQRQMLEYFRTPFDPKLEMSVPKRTVATTVTFRPDPRGEGILWDSPLNWTTGDLPTTVAADTVNLHGNFVRFNRLTQIVASIKFDGGTLDVVSGKLTAQAHADAANVRVRLAGQYFAPANANGDYIAEGGRLVFGGAATVDLEVAGDAECDLGPNFTARADGELTLNGGDLWVGWNGTGTRTATGPLAFVEVDGKVGKLQRFKRRGDVADPTVTATYALTALRIDVTTPGTYDLGGGAGTGVTYTNPGNITLPAGLTLTNGKLTLVV